MKTSKIHYLHVKKAIGSTCRVHIFASFERALRSRGLLLLSALFTLPAFSERINTCSSATIICISTKYYNNYNTFPTVFRFTLLSHCLQVPKQSARYRTSS